MVTPLVVANINFTNRQNICALYVAQTKKREVTTRSRVFAVPKRLTNRIAVIYFSPTKGEKRLGEVMRFGQTALLAGLSLVLMQPALAGGWNEQCDWFENAAIGTRCAQSWSFSTGLSYDWYGYKSSGLSGVNSVDEQYFPSFALAVTPNSWLTLSYTSDYGFDNHSWTFSDGSHGSSSLSYAYRQILEANANVIDTGPGSQRYVVNVYGGGAIVPAHDGYDEQTGVFGGLVANGQWRLGSSGFSIDGRAQLEIDERAGGYSNGVSPSNVFVYPYAQLLLSNDKAGIAAGPVLHSAQWLSTSLSGGVGSQSDYYALGGTAIAQPFRSSQSPLLNGIILQATATESLGQAGMVPSSVAKTSEVDVSGTVSFHFRY